MTDLFWAHLVSLELLHAFSHVLIIDCTYMMNMYRMPLLEIVGLTSTNMTFVVAFAYLQYEREDNFAWPLSILCDAIGDNAHPHVIVMYMEVTLMNAISSL